MNRAEFAAIYDELAMLLSSPPPADGPPCRVGNCINPTSRGERCLDCVTEQLTVMVGRRLANRYIHRLGRMLEAERAIKTRLAGGGR